MNTADLKTHFTEGFKSFHLDRRNMERYLQPPFITLFPETIINELLFIAVTNLINDLEIISRDIDIRIELETGFTKSQKEKNKSYESLLRATERFTDEDYIRLFTIDDFHNEIFTENGLKKICNHFLFGIEKELPKWLNSNSKEKENLTTEDWGIFLSYYTPNERQKIKHSFEILLKAKFLKIKLEELKPQVINKGTAKLKLPQIALIYVYKEKVITRGNDKKIANKYGYTSKNSGEKLYQLFIKYFKPTDRKGDEGTRQKNKNKIKLIESVFDLLPTDKQNRAKDEISILTSIQKTEY